MSSNCEVNFIMLYTDTVSVIMTMCPCIEWVVRRSSWYQLPPSIWVSTNEKLVSALHLCDHWQEVHGTSFCLWIWVATNEKLINGTSFLAGFHSPRCMNDPCDEWLPEHLHLRWKLLPFGRNDSPYPCHCCMNWLERVRMPGAFASEHSNVITGKSAGGLWCTVRQVDAN